MPDPEPEPPPPDFETDEYLAQEGLVLVNASDAYDRDGSGQNVIIGVIDTGLDVSHPEFQGQVAPGGFDFILNTATMSDPFGHGTHVSGIAAARKDDVGMHGIAYNADILPIRIFEETGSTTLTDAEIAVAIDYAVARGAMVINNSWGSSTPVTLVTRADILAEVPEETAAWGRTVDNDTVVVFATGNDFVDQPSVRAGLPYHFPEYENLWLAVMAVELDGGDPIYSNACGVAAAWCLAAPGGGITAGNPGVFSTLPVAQGSYGRVTGTSMAAPHVSGAVAVLMQLFPELSPDQIVARVLETADKSGIYADASIFGQGLLDLEAATRPIGVAMILTGNTIADEGHPLNASMVDLGPAFGDGLAQSLRGAKLAVFDKYGATFAVDLDSLIRLSDGTTDVAALLDRFGSIPQRAEIGQSASVSMRFSAAPDEIAQDNHQGYGPRVNEFSLTSTLDDSEATASYNRHPAMNFGLHQTNDIDRSLIMSDDAFFAPYLSFASEGYNFALSTDLAEVGTLRFGSFLGQQDGDIDFSDTSGSMAELAIPFSGEGLVALQLGTVSESDTMLGSRTQGAFDTSGTTTYFGGLAGKLGLTDTVSIVGSYFTGVSNLSPTSNSLFSDISSIYSNAFSLGLVGHDAVADGDRTGFLINQPLRVTKAKATLSHATGRTRDGTVLKEETKTNLAPSGREIDLEAFYETALGKQTTFGASLMLRTQPGHVANADEEGVILLRFNHEF